MDLIRFVVMMKSNRKLLTVTKLYHRKSSFTFFMRNAEIHSNPSRFRFEFMLVIKFCAPKIRFAANILCCCCNFFLLSFFSTFFFTFSSVFGYFWFASRASLFSLWPGHFAHTHWNAMLGKLRRDGLRRTYKINAVDIIIIIIWKKIK